MNKLKSKKTYILSALIIITGFHLVYGLEIVLPGNTNWIMSAYHDWGQHYLGWAYFRSEPWHFPLGHIENFNYPAGTNVGYTDSIPLLAIFFKIFSFLLPPTFQYLGLWLLACHLLTGFYTIRILKLFEARTGYVLLAVVVVAFNPVLVYRAMHPALCAHWLILACIYYYIVRPDSGNVAGLNKKLCLLIVLAALINPYLLLMVVGFGFILPYRHYYFDRLVSFKRMVIYMVAPIVLVLVSWVAVGLLSFGNEVKMSVQNGYGLYGLNLNSLWNPWGYSPIFPQLNTTAPQQYEGFAYLGLGVFILLATVLFTAVPVFLKKQYKNKRLFPLLAMAVFFTVFAITHQVTYGEKTLFTVPIPEFLIEFGGIFRASGRFIWLFYYLLLFAPLVLLAKCRIPEALKLGLLSAITILQIYDTRPLLTCRVLPSGEYASHKITEREWVALTSKFKRIITVPPFENSLVYPMSYQDLCWVALKNKIPITCGYVARETQEINTVFKDSLLLDVNDALIRKDDIFITSPAELPNFYNLISKNKAELRYLDGFYCLYAKGSTVPLNKTQAETIKVDSVLKFIEKSNRFQQIARPAFSQDKIELNLEKSNYGNDILRLSGWAVRREAFENSNDSIFVLLTNDKKTFLFKANPVKRQDITINKKKGNLDNAGFSLSIHTNKLNGAKYTLALAIKDKNSQWTYQLLNHVPEFEFRKKSPPLLLHSLPQSTTKGKVIGNVEKVAQQSGYILISGWAATDNQHATGSVIKVLLRDGKTIYELETDKTFRDDVTNTLKNGFNYDDSGFSLKCKAVELPKGEYSVGFVVIGKEKAVFFSDKKLILK